MSDRKMYHIDQRAQAILAGLVQAKISPDQLLSTRKLATLFSVSEAWLLQLRLNKRGPKYVVLSPRCVRYKMADVLAWLDGRARAHARKVAA